MIRKPPAPRSAKPAPLEDKALDALAGGTRVTGWDKVQELRTGK